MGKLFFVAEDPTISISRYASRISQSTWQKHRAIIQRLHEQGLTRREIVNELARHGFHPSFGQLVAQMARWQLVRYSKPLQVPTRAKEPPPPGIMGLISILLSADPNLSYGWAGGTPASSNNDSVAPQLSQLMSALSVNTKVVHCSSGLEPPQVNHEYNSCSQLLGAADMLFLGESYAHAFHTYRDVQRRTSSPAMTVTVEEEQLQVQATIGCLKSAANSNQREEGIAIAQEFLDHLIKGAFPPTSLQSPSDRSLLRTTFDRWQSGDCATAKAVFELLTTYKKHRSWTTASQACWATGITVQEWASLRLVRIPTWQEAATFLNSAPVSCVQPNEVFNPENLMAILNWAIAALQGFGAWYDEQVLQLKLEPTIPESTFRSLLFWRLNFSSRHSLVSCPSLHVRLSSESSYVASAQQTACVLAHVILKGQCMPSTSNTLKTTLLYIRGAIEKGCTDMVFAEFWHGLGAALTPSYDQRSGRASP